MMSCKWTFLLRDIPLERRTCYWDRPGVANIRPRGVTVSTLDSESSDRGSNPREAFLLPAHYVCMLAEKSSLRRRALS